MIVTYKIAYSSPIFDASIVRKKCTFITLCRNQNRKDMYIIQNYTYGTLLNYTDSLSKCDMIQ